MSAASVNRSRLTHVSRCVGAGMLGFLGAMWLQPVAARAADAAADGAMPLVGAIRWDGWFQDNRWEKFLGPKQWHDRLPFYARVISQDRVEVRSDSQQVMDEEIALASSAGLNYWAFCYYHPDSFSGADAYNYGWRRYLASSRMRDLDFCLILQGGWLGPKEKWPQTAAMFAALFKERTYVKVAGGRPLLFMFTCEAIEPHFGSKAEAVQAFDELRSQCQQAGVEPPYIVAQVFSAAHGVKWLDEFGFDAIGAYSAPGSGEHRERPYSDLRAANRQSWDGFKATGRKVVPTVNAGWDGRPRMTDAALAKHYGGPWYRMPKPAELADRVACPHEFFVDENEAKHPRRISNPDFFARLQSCPEAAKVLDVFRWGEEKADSISYLSRGAAVSTHAESAATNDVVHDLPNRLTNLIDGSVNDGGTFADKEQDEVVVITLKAPRCVRG